MVSRVGAWFLSICCWSVAATAQTKSPVLVPLRAEITGPSSCHTSDVFLQEILSRTPQATLAHGGEVGWSLRVFVSEQGSRYEARLSVLANEGVWLDRELVAPTCDDALTALAVVVAILVETAAEQPQQLPPTHNTPRTPDTVEPRRQSVPLPYVAGGVWVPWLDDPNYFEKRGVIPVSATYVRSFSTTVELDNQLVRTTTIGLGLGFDVSRWHPNLFNPTYSLSMGWASGDLTRDDVSIQATRLSLRGAVCPVELLRQRSLGLRPCARLDGGFVYAQFRQENDLFARHSKRYTQLRTTPFARLSWIPIAGAELRLDAGVDLELY
jgi:hypothetical protein